MVSVLRVGDRTPRKAFSSSPFLRRSERPFCMWQNELNELIEMEPLTLC